MVRIFDGLVVPMPTLTAKCPVPPSTSELLCSTSACAPIAVALETSPDALQAMPMQVRSEPVELLERAETPTAVFSDPVVLLPSAPPPKATLKDANRLVLHELPQLLA